MKLTIDIENATKIVTDIEVRDNVTLPKTFRIVSDNVDDAKISLTEMFGAIFKNLESVNDELHPNPALEDTDVASLVDRMAEGQDVFDHASIEFPIDISNAPRPPQLFDTNEEAARHGQPLVVPDAILDPSE